LLALVLRQAGITRRQWEDVSDGDRVELLDVNQTRAPKAERREGE